MNLDINNPEHNPEEIFGKFYYNYDKKQTSWGIVRTRGGFQLSDVAVFFGIRKDKVEKVIVEDMTFTLLLKSWENYGWIEYHKDFQNISHTVFCVYYTTTPEGQRVAKEWKKKDKQEKIRKRQINRYGMPLRDYLQS